MNRGHMIFLGVEADSEADSLLTVFESKYYLES